MRFAVWGLTGTLALEDEAGAPEAQRTLWRWLDAFDRACNRFDPASELSALNAHAGQDVTVSPLLAQALEVALRAADATDGACDPTVEPALGALGYDADFDVVRQRPDHAARPPVAALGPGAVTLDARARRVRLAPGCRLDLGATAKALACDVIADALAPTGGVLVEIGGDVAVRGAGPDGPWVVGVADTGSPGREPRVYAHGGGLATSSTRVRTWRVGDEVAHHVVDPRTGRPAAGTYATATVAAPTCWQANAFATAALVWGAGAPERIARAGWAARLVTREGTVAAVGGWPVEEPACSP